MTPRPYACAAGSTSVSGAAPGEVVEALLADQAERTAARCRLVGLGDVPAGEVAGAGVEDLALGDQDVDRLPDLVQGVARSMWWNW